MLLLGGCGQALHLVAYLFRHLHTITEEGAEELEIIRGECGRLCLGRVRVEIRTMRRVLLGEFVHTQTVNQEIGANAVNSQQEGANALKSACG